MFDYQGFIQQALPLSGMLKRGGMNEDQKQRTRDAIIQGMRDGAMAALDDYRQTWRWLRRPLSRPPTGTFWVMGFIVMFMLLQRLFL